MYRYLTALLKNYISVWYNRNLKALTFKYSGQHLNFFFCPIYIKTLYLHLKLGIFLINVASGGLLTIFNGTFLLLKPVRFF